MPSSSAAFGSAPSASSSSTTSGRSSTAPQAQSSAVRPEGDAGKCSAPARRLRPLRTHSVRMPRCRCTLLRMQAGRRRRTSSRCPVDLGLRDGARGELPSHRVPFTTLAQCNQPLRHTAQTLALQRRSRWRAGLWQRPEIDFFKFRPGGLAFTTRLMVGTISL